MSTIYLSNYTVLMMTIEDQGGKVAARDKLVDTQLTDDVGFLLAKLHAAGSVLNNRALTEFGLKERSYSVLVLASSGLEPTQRELADFLSLDPSQVVALVDDLEGCGLVERTQDRQDRRSKIIVSTSEGRTLHAKARAALNAAEREHLSTLSEEESKELKRLLRKALWQESM